MKPSRTQATKIDGVKRWHDGFWTDIGTGQDEAYSRPTIRKDRGLSTVTRIAGE
jgi:hypothetical protein